MSDNMTVGSQAKLKSVFIGRQCFEILEENRMLRLEIEKLRNGPGADINSL